MPQVGGTAREPAPRATSRDVAPRRATPRRATLRHAALYRDGASVRPPV